MPIFEPTTFIFTTCQAGTEPALKDEVKREHPELKFAFSRPGFVTFKGAITGDFRSIFARAYGTSIARLASQDGTLEEKAEWVAQWIADHAVPVTVHVWEREQYAPSEEPKDFEPGKWKRAAIQALSQALQKRSLQIPINSPVSKGTILDVVTLEENEWFIGTHSAGLGHNPVPGGTPQIELPPRAPSRAYLKLQEALLWSKAPLRPGDTAVEIGSAPGGASYCLLEKGLNVVGIDPGKMDPEVLKFPTYSHIDQPVSAILRTDLPKSVEWLLLDMNVAPSVALYAIDRLGTRMKDSLLGLFLTLKLSDWKKAKEIPSYLAHIQAMGMSLTRATHLPSNRQEIFVYALTRKGVSRKSNQNTAAR